MGSEASRNMKLKKFSATIGLNPSLVPRFRNAFYIRAGEEVEPGETFNHDVVIIRTRTGGGNREEYENDNYELTQNPNYMRDYDDEDDCTYAYFFFSVPEGCNLGEGESKTPPDSPREQTDIKISESV